MFSSLSPEWSTPQYLFDKFNKVYNFDIDVCADETNTKCEKFFSINNSCLEQTWGGVDVG